MTVYFIRAGEDGPVKIGYSADARRRFMAIETASTTQLHVLREIAGGPVTEAWLHRRFAKQRLRGEWFEFSAEMLTIAPPKSLLGADHAPIYKDEGLKAELRELVIALVDFMPGDNQADRITKAAEILGLKRERARKWFYGDARQVASGELEIIRSTHALFTAKLGRLKTRYELARTRLVARYQSPVADCAAYEAQRREFVATAPRALGWLAPPSVETSEVSEVAPSKVRA